MFEGIVATGCVFGVIFLLGRIFSGGGDAEDCDHNWVSDGAGKLKCTKCPGWREVK